MQVLGFQALLRPGCWKPFLQQREGVRSVLPATGSPHFQLQDRGEGVRPLQTRPLLSPCTNQWAMLWFTWCVSGIARWVREGRQLL